MKPLVSIQIPTYNQKQYIKQALDSALAQTYENLQIIVSDDCSNEYDIFDYLKDYCDNPKVLLHRNEINLGRVGNYRNTLYNLVEGEWFVNLDGDDYFINENFISRAISTIYSQNKKIAFFQANAQIKKFSYLKINHEKLDTETFIVKGIDYTQILDDGLGFSHGSFLFKAKQAKDADFYNFDILDADYFSFLKMLKNDYIIFWNQGVYIWREHDLQETRTINFEKVMNKYNALRNLQLYYSDIPFENTKKMFKQIELNLFSQLAFCLSNQKFSLKSFIRIMQKLKFRRIYLRIFLKSVLRLIIKR